jgi:hypothetical protein
MRSSECILLGGLQCFWSKNTQYKTRRCCTAKQSRPHCAISWVPSPLYFPRSGSSSPAPRCGAVVMEVLMEKVWDCCPSQARLLTSDDRVLWSATKSHLFYFETLWATMHPAHVRRWRISCYLKAPLRCNNPRSSGIQYRAQGKDVFS